MPRSWMICATLALWVEAAGAAAPPVEQPDYVKVEVRGTLLVEKMKKGFERPTPLLIVEQRLFDDNRKTKVYYALDLRHVKKPDEAWNKLSGKKVIVTGELREGFYYSGFGGTFVASPDSRDKVFAPWGHVRRIRVLTLKEDK